MQSAQQKSSLGELVFVGGRFHTGSMSLAVSGVKPRYQDIGFTGKDYPGTSRSKRIEQTCQNDLFII